MAETALSMARSVLGSAVSKAASAASAEMSLLMGVQNDIWFIKDELKTMQAFLMAAEKMKKKDMLLKVWVEQVRDLSYNIEDSLDEFMVHVGSQSLSQQLMKLKDRHRIAVQIRNLRSRVDEVSNRNTRYNLIRTEASDDIDELDSYMEDVRNYSASNIDEADLVGFAESKKELIKLMDISTEDDIASVICIVGMGGLGKTTLAKKTYKSKQDIVKNFSYRAWITVSQSFSKIELVKDMIMQLLGNDALKECLENIEGKTVQPEDLGNYLREKLTNKRYFVVLDDLWTLQAWDWINNISFPSNNKKSSRIVVTTRDIGLAMHCTSKSLIYHLKPLQTHDAISLLLRKSRRRHENMVNYEDVVNKIVKKCGCLPLAILTVGGMLATKMVTEWESIYNQLPSELESNRSLETMRRVVTLSYNHLPSHLKSCFLYLSIFPEDYDIQRNRLVDRWISEGFVRARAGMTARDVGESYFNELINRSLIQPSKVNIEGNVKSCRVHDIVRDIMISISRDENFVCLMGDNGTSVAEENFRHVAYHGSNCPGIGITWSHVRSLTLFGERPMEPAPSLCSPQLRMLRTLDLQDVQFKITQQDMNNILLLHHLKYVNLWCAKSYYDIFSEKTYYDIYKLPSSIGKLKGLQTLDIRDNHIATLPSEICKLQNLRILRCKRKGYYKFFEPDSPMDCLSATLSIPMLLLPRFGYRDEAIAEVHMACSSRWSESEGVRVPKGIGNLKELEILETVDIRRTSSKAVEELGKLTQLRKLGLMTVGATKQKYQILCASIAKLSSLRSLRLHTKDGTSEWFNSIPPTPLLKTLHLIGYLKKMPYWCGRLMHLVKIDIRRSCVEELLFIAGAFPNLKKLVLMRVYRLRKVKFEEGTSPQMARIEISGCDLESGIIGVGHLPRLKEISLGRYRRVGNLGMLQAEVNAHTNHPVLQLGSSLSNDEAGPNIEAEAAESHPEPAGEISSHVVMLTTNPSEGDRGLGKAGGSNVEHDEDDDDDFSSCVSISDGHGDDVGDDDAC